MDAASTLVSPPARVSVREARRIAIAAQGLARIRPAPGTVSRRRVRSVIERLRVVQIDSVNVLTRSQYLPLFSRLGPYDTALFDAERDLAPRRRPRVVEHWVHEASLVPVETWPHLAFRMRREPGRAGFRERHPSAAHVYDDALGHLAVHGPSTARAVEAALAHERPTDRSNWGWNWSDVKNALEYAFSCGEATSAGRTTSFERRYALPSQVLPAEVLARAPGTPGEPDAEESTRALTLEALRAVGIGTLRCIRDYHRLRADGVERALATLESEGLAEPVRVPGWSDRVWLDPAAVRPRRVRARALLSPFDSFVWQRERAEDLFGFRYRLEIYVPAPKRVYGYYVLPFLLGEDLVARVDLKADRAAGILQVKAVHLEPDAPPHTTAELGEELRSMADWLGLDDVVFSGSA